MLMGRCGAEWQDVAYVLKLFGGATVQGRRQYREFVRKAAGRRKRSDLSGGGLVRSVGGWKAIQEKRKSGDRSLGDERILGDGDFVENALAECSERLERRCHFKAEVYDFERVAERVAAVFDMPVNEVLREGKYARTVIARSVLCYWANRELGISTVELARKLEAGTANCQSVCEPRPADRSGKAVEFEIIKQWASPSA